MSLFDLPFVGWTVFTLGLVVVVVLVPDDPIVATESTRLGEYVGFPANSNDGIPDGGS